MHGGALVSYISLKKKKQILGGNELSIIASWKALVLLLSYIVKRIYLYSGIWMVIGRYPILLHHITVLGKWKMQ